MVTQKKLQILLTCAFVLLSTTDLSAQKTLINYQKNYQLNDIISCQHNFIAVGSEFEKESETPLILCFDVNGDTLWTKKSPSYFTRGKFTKIDCSNDTLTILGSGTGDIYPKGYSIILRLDRNGVFLGDGYVENQILTDIKIENTRMYLVGYSSDQYKKGLFTMSGNTDISGVQINIINPPKSLKNEYTAQSFVMNDSTFWTCGQCFDNGFQRLNTSLLTKDFELIESNSFFTAFTGECKKIMKSTSGNFYLCGVANTGKKKKALVLTVMNSNRKIIHNKILFESKEDIECNGIYELKNGKIIILSSIKNVPILFGYDTITLSATVLMKEHKNLIPVKLIESKDNDTFFILVKNIAAETDIKYGLLKGNINFQ